MVVQSEWQPGAAVTFTPGPLRDTLGSIRGEVLAAEPHRRLSYSLASGPGHPTTYVTWEVSAGEDGGGSRVRLYVDETETTSDPDEESAASWAGVVAGLRTVLAGLLLG